MDAQLLGRQILYKASTKRFIEWLVQTAERVTNTPTPVATAPSSSRKRDSSKKLTTRDIVSFAEIISNSSALVPPAIIRFLEEVIEGRQACANWYARLPLTEDLTDENESHAFFIEVLRRVLQLLSGTARPQCQADKETKPKSTKKQSLNDLGCDFNNLFAQLELEEPSDEPLGQAPTFEITIEFGNKKSSISLGDGDNKDDTAFRLFCFLEDAKDVRVFLKETCTEYERGDLSMAAVATITEAGIALLRISSTNFTAANEAFRDWPYLLEYLGLEQQTTHFPRESPFIYIHPRSTDPSSHESKSTTDLPDLICAASAYHLQDLKAKMHEEAAKHDPRDLKKGAFVSGMPLDHDVFDFPLSLLIPAAVEFVTWRLSPEAGSKRNTGNRNGTFVSSEFVEGILTYYRTKQLAPWLPIACQIYCDIYEIIGADAARMANQYLDEVSEMQRIVQRQRTTFGGPHMTPCWEKTLNQLNRNHQSFSFYLRADTKKLLRNCKTDLGLTDGVSLKSIQSLPCVMGTQLWRYKMAFHQAGISGACRGNIVLCMAHLYLTGRKLGVMQSEWHDMDMVISAQKSIEPLVTRSGSRTDAVTCLKHFLLALGVPAREFADNKIPGLPSNKHYAEKAKRPVNTLQLPKTGNETSRVEEELGVWRGEVLELMLTSMTKKINETQPSKKGVKKQHAPTGLFTPKQLLSTFKKAFIADEPMLNFDFFAFSFDCAMMEHYIRDHVMPNLETEFDLPHRDLLNSYEFLYHLLVSHIRQDPPSLETSPGRGITALERACKFLEVYIGQKAQNNEQFSSNKFSTAAFRQSSGRIPKDLRPKFRKFDYANIETSPMEQMLANEEAVFSHFTAAHKVVYDPRGSAQKFKEMAEWQKGEEQSMKKEMGLKPEDPFPGWACAKPVKIHVSELGLSEEDLAKFDMADLKQKIALNELISQAKIQAAMDRKLQE